MSFVCPLHVLAWFKVNEARDFVLDEDKEEQKDFVIAKDKQEQEKVHICNIITALDTHKKDFQTQPS